ncbi:hypothetical protein CIHG_02903 [Coccidioides immitis H538.4]|uniref:RING-type domain-containing protein n=1 Tax=Coccidioides immitis H538.4 TaxID=396776 RepID=A0A0J8RKE7_COCIT|nr:hypothetical protein CIHG_02903 [Coccidioides immitis H538.4]
MTFIASADSETSTQQAVQDPDEFFSSPVDIEGGTDPDCLVQCRICLDDVLTTKTVQSCRQCSTSYCDSCLRKWFLEACDEESKMPPKCCCALNAGLARKYLCHEELQLFVEKYDEVRTTNRVYCPVSRCSAFISYNLFPIDARPLEYNYPDLIKKGKASNGTASSIQPATAKEASHPSEDRKNLSDPNAEKISLVPEAVASPTVACPKCAVPICCVCKQLAHPGSPCPTSKEDTELEEVLQKFKIKRCPKCGRGIRKMYGCPKMACICGYNWCWLCGRPTQICGNRESQCSRPDTSDEDEKTETDLDSGGDQEWEESGYDFGSEPEQGAPEPWGCRHCYIIGEKCWAGIEVACELCWKGVLILDDPKGDRCGGEPSNSRGRGTDESTDEETPRHKTIILQCSFCEQMVCEDCYEATVVFGP